MHVLLLKSCNYTNFKSEIKSFKLNIQQVSVVTKLNARSIITGFPLYFTQFSTERIFTDINKKFKNEEEKWLAKL